MKSSITRRLFGNSTSTQVAMAGELAWQCNVCGVMNSCPVKSLDREESPCHACHAVLRFRMITAALTLRMFGAIKVLADLPARPDVKGIGMTDSECYAGLLAAKFGYTNTYYHRKPLLDIKNPDPGWLGVNDFVITSDVFEHVPPPVQIAFDNLLALLKPGGVAIFSVPFSYEEDTREHYPELHRFNVRQEENGDWMLENLTKDGRQQKFRDLLFHGGPGSTLEMRLFSLAALQRHFAQAGFVDLQVHSEPHFEYGIYWWKPWSLIISARKPVE